MKVGREAGRKRREDGKREVRKVGREEEKMRGR